MRVLFLLLVLANVAFFAWSRLIAPGGSGADPAPLSRQIAPEKLRIVPADERARLSAPKRTNAAPSPRPAAATAAAAPRCLEWGSFPPADAARAEQMLQALDLGERVSRRTAEEAANWWVFIPAQSQAQNVRQAALRKAGELKKLGVRDYFIVQDEGPTRWAISLGVFRTEEAAEARLASLRTQGVRSARLAPREAHVAKVWFQVRGVDAALEGRLAELAVQREGSELRACVP